MDYATMTDAELNAQVAQRQGYKSVLCDDRQGSPWILLTPDGYELPERYVGEATSDDAWLLAPDYCGDLNAAWELLNAIPNEYTVDISRIPNDSNESMWWAKVDLLAKHHGRADSPARAIVLAWLQWQEAR